MARTPVAIETETPKRTPVVIDEIEKAIDERIIGGLADEDAEAALTLLEERRDEIKPIIDGYRECARPGCGASFKPRSVNPKDDDATEYYCSSDCAIHEFYRKRGLGSVPEKVVSGASTSSNRAHREEKQRKRAEDAPEKDARYGPMRKVVEVIGETKTAKKVKLECGHITTSRGDQQRCRKCRTGRVEAKETENGEALRNVHVRNRQPVPADGGGNRTVQETGNGTQRNQKRSQSNRSRTQRSKSVARPVSIRTPVKPSKRGKKGK